MKRLLFLRLFHEDEDGVLVVAEVMLDSVVDEVGGCF